MARFWGIKEEELWRLWIDYDKQADNNPLIFDSDEPGYAAGMLNGWSFMTRGVAKALTLASFIDLHDAAITYLSTEGTYGEYAAQTIGQISCLGPEHNKEIGEKGGIEILIKVLHWTPEWVLFALVNLSENCLENQKRVGKNGGLDVIIKILLSSCRVGAQLYSSKLIEILSCGCPENKQRVLDHGGINALLNVLATAVYPKLQKTAVRALKTLAENYADNQKAIREKGGIDVLIKLFASSSDADTKNEITALLRMLSPKAAEVKNPIATLGFFSGEVGQEEVDEGVKYQIKSKPFS